MDVILATGILAFTLVPKSPHDTNRLLGGLVPWSGWLSEREADVFVARIIRADPKKGQASTMSIGLKDMWVLCSQSNSLTENLELFTDIWI